jgi:predicted enzyme related to lactoylglutathione lyase
VPHANPNSRRQIVDDRAGPKSTGFLERPKGPHRRPWPCATLQMNRTISEKICRFSSWPVVYRIGADPWARKNSQELTASSWKIHRDTRKWGSKYPGLRTDQHKKELASFKSGQIRATSKENVMANAFVHVELNTTDVNKAKNFYGSLFDWKLEDVPMGPGNTYTMIKVGEGTAGGILKHPVPGAPSAWLAYVLVDDIAAATKKAKSLGATVMKDVTEVMGMGSFSVLIDPTGAAIALWQPKAK